MDKEFFKYLLEKVLIVLFSTAVSVLTVALWYYANGKLDLFFGK